MSDFPFPPASEESAPSEATIPEEMTVSELIRRHPRTLAVLRRYGVDACCAGAEPVRVAARRDGVDPEALVSALQRAIRPSPG